MLIILDGSRCRAKFCRCAIGPFVLQLTFDTFAALFERVDVAVDTALAGDLVANEVGIVRRCDEVMGQGLGHVVVPLRCCQLVGQILPL